MSENKKQPIVGGQAVIEGVMMRGKDGIATAIRKKDGQINVDFEQYIPINKRNKFFALPIIRGFMTYIDSLIIGVKILSKSVDALEEEEEDEAEEKLSKFDLFIQKVFKDKYTDVIMGISLVISLAFTLGVFYLLPNVITNLFTRVGINSSIILNFIESLIRVSILVGYLSIISMQKDVKRLFRYHGAEHKTIFCYENNERLTVENARKYTTLHPRCGTSFIFVVFFVSLVIYLFLGWQHGIMRIVTRLLLLPLISGISYELIRLMASRENAFLKAIAFPGLMFQKITTKEPSDDMLEVAITALKRAEGIEYEDDNKQTPEPKLQEAL